MNADERLSELESRLVYQDQAIDQLSDVIRDQWERIDRLQREIKRLEHRVAELEQGDSPEANVPPPHY